MPNWCSNYVYIKGNQTVIDKIRKEIDDKKERPQLFSLFYPVPEELQYTVSHPPTKTDEEIAELVKKYGVEDWYYWSINNWGCKWEAREIEIMESDPKEIYLRFDTPWSPPINFYKNLANDYRLNSMQPIRKRVWLFVASFSHQLLMARFHLVMIVSTHKSYGTKCCLATLLHTKINK